MRGLVSGSRLDKLRLGMSVETSLENHVERRVLTVLPIEFRHLVSCFHLPLHHRDPFDRLIAAQAISLHWPIVTSDSGFDPYAVETVW